MTSYACAVDEAVAMWRGSGPLPEAVSAADPQEVNAATVFFRGKGILKVSNWSLADSSAHF